MKPTSLRRSSIAPTWIGTSGIASAIRAIPSGAAIRARSLIRGTPAALRISQAWTAEPPVASIGSTTRATRDPGPGGELVVILDRPERRARRGTGRCARPRPRGSGRGRPRPCPARRGGSARSRRCRPGRGPAAVPSGVVTSTGLVGRSAVASWASRHGQAPDQLPELGRPGRASPAAPRACDGPADASTGRPAPRTPPGPRTIDRSPLRRSFPTIVHHVHAFASRFFDLNLLVAIERRITRNG